MPAQADIEHLLRRTEFVARPDRGRVPDGGRPNLERPSTTSWRSRSTSRARRSSRSPTSGARARSTCTSGSTRWRSTRAARSRSGWRCSGTATSAPACARSTCSNRSASRSSSSAAERHQHAAHGRRHHVDPAGDAALPRQRPELVTSPNQNFGRELMELFLLGIGNYSEADVEACAAAWTGHTDIWATGRYHGAPTCTTTTPRRSSAARSTRNPAARSSTGRDDRRDPRQRHTEPVRRPTPPWSPTVADRPTRSPRSSCRASSGPSSPAPSRAPRCVNALRDVAIANNFAIKPWLRALLLHPEFYSADVKQGLVRSPVELMVAFMFHDGDERPPGAAPVVARGHGATPAGATRRQRLEAQRVLRQRQRDVATAPCPPSTSCGTDMLGFWAGDGLIHLGAGSISRAQAESRWRGQPDQFVDLLLADAVDADTRDHARCSTTFARRTSWSSGSPS